MENRGLITLLSFVATFLVIMITWFITTQTYKTSPKLKSETTQQGFLVPPDSERNMKWDPIVDNYKINERAQKSIDSLRNINDSIEMNNNSRRYGNIEQKTVESLKIHTKELSKEIVDITIDLYSDINFNDLRKDSTIVIDNFVYNVCIELKPHITLNGEKINVRWRILE